jgi:oligopeptide/dipeptide ABC transporter ATP-binding protein
VRLKNLQYVFQDPAGSLNPRRLIRAALHEPLIIHTAMNRDERDQQIQDITRAVGIGAALLDRYPHELSGGQQRRVGLARTLVLRPRVVVLDEPTAGIDLSVRAALLDLLLDLRSQFNLTYVFISHDLRVIESVADRLAVMYLGRIVEEGEAGSVFSAPQHPYTQSLMNAIPDIGGARVIERFVLEGEPVSPLNLPTGCRFRYRCPRASEICARIDPPARRSGSSSVACHHPLTDIASEAIHDER